MKRLRCLAAAAAFLVLAPPVHAASKSLTREETVALFARLSKAAKTAKTFQAKMHREERTGFVIDAKPLVYKGRWLVRRPPPKEVGEHELPLNFRQDISRPRRSAMFITQRDFWVSFPESKEAQHADLAKGPKASANAAIESFTLWLYFDLDAIEKAYRVKARPIAPPAGLVIRKDGEGAEIKPEKMYRVTFAPRDEEKATFVELSLWLEGDTPWPLKIEKETDEGTVTTEFSEIVLDAPLDAKLFKFTRPRGTKVQELGG